MMKLSILLLTSFLLLSCHKEITTEKFDETRNQVSLIGSYKFSLINKPNTIMYRFLEWGAGDFSRDVDLVMYCKGDSSNILVETKINDGLLSIPRTISRETRNFIAEHCATRKFVERLSEIEEDTCFVYNSYSLNNKNNSSIFFVDSVGSVNYIPFKGMICSKEKNKTKLDSVEYDIRSYFTSVNAWEKLIKKGSLREKELKVLDTVVFKKSKMDSRLSNGKILFYPMNTRTLKFLDPFVRNIDTLDYYMAHVDNDSIVYVQNTKGTRNEYRDSDTETLQHYFSQLDSYEREFWEVNAFDCRDNGHIIYWNDSTFNFVTYHCMSKEQKIWHLDRNIKEWFEQKFNKTVHKQQ